jgi:hypothetical protein
MNIEGFSFKKEGFNSYEYSEEPRRQRDVVRNTRVLQGRQRLNDTKDVVIQKQYFDLSQNIVLYSTNRNNLANDPTYDFSGNKLLFVPDKTDPIKTTEDVMKNDINTLLLQQNYVYIIGSITCATLLIGVLIIGK